MGRIVIVGGYGAFGARASQRLARDDGADLIIAGRSADTASRFTDALARSTSARIAPAALDATTATPEQIAKLSATVVINASGPFQAQDYALARACIAARCHYVDLADARAFVTGIARLDARAREAGVAVISGASSVPGLSSAAVAQLAMGFAHLDEVETGISPGNSFDPGLATVRSILGAVGKPYSVREDGRRQMVYGWQGLHRRRFSGLGTRFMSNVEVPDLDLMPAHYPSLKSARFAAGLEVAPFHLALWSLSWLVRWDVVDSLAPLASALLAIKGGLHSLGSNRGGMYVALRGVDANGAPREATWTLIAGSGDGPYVPAIAAVILARRLAAGDGVAPGARACFAEFTLADFAAATADLDISSTISLSRPPD